MGVYFRGGLFPIKIKLGFLSVGVYFLDPFFLDTATYLKLNHFVFQEHFASLRSITHWIFSVTGPTHFRTPPPPPPTYLYLILVAIQGLYNIKPQRFCL